MNCSDGPPYAPPHCNRSTSDWQASPFSLQEKRKREQVQVEIDPGVLKAIAEAEAGRGAADGTNGESRAKEIESQMEGILDRARQIANTSDDTKAKQTEEQLRRDFEGLISALGSASKIPRDDIRRLKDKVFEPQVFWVTEMCPVEDAGAIGETREPPTSFHLLSLPIPYLPATHIRLPPHPPPLDAPSDPFPTRPIATPPRALCSHDAPSACTPSRCHLHLHPFSPAPLLDAPSTCTLSSVPAESPELLEVFGVGGWLIRGNLRKEKTIVFTKLCAAIDELFGDKYTAFMVPDPVPLPEGPGVEPPEERPAFIVVPKEAVQPVPAAGWQVFVGLVVSVRPAGEAARSTAPGAAPPPWRPRLPPHLLSKAPPLTHPPHLLLQLLLLTTASHFQLGIVANVTRLPPEALQALANPEAFNPDAPIPGMTDTDILEYIYSALPIAFGALGANLTHELGHRLAAAVRGVTLGPSFYLPNSQLGTFGAITPIRSVLRSLDDLWDVSFAGPLAGGLASLALFLYGLGATAGAAGDPAAAAALVPVPTPLFQGSLLLGAVCKGVLGDAAFQGITVGLHPMTIAGWCGLVTTSLNLLPVGALDGGRMAQAAFGRNGLNLTSFFTYVGLALGILGSSLGECCSLYQPAADCFPSIDSHGVETGEERLPSSWTPCASRPWSVT